MYNTTTRQSDVTPLFTIVYSVCLYNQSTGATVIAIGVGKQANKGDARAELKSIASPGTDGKPLVFFADGFLKLLPKLANISASTCNPVPGYGEMCDTECRSVCRSVPFSIS